RLARNQVTALRLRFVEGTSTGIARCILGARSRALPRRRLCVRLITMVRLRALRRSVAPRLAGRELSFDGREANIVNGLEAIRAYSSARDPIERVEARLRFFFVEVDIGISTIEQELVESPIQPRPLEVRL